MKGGAISVVAAWCLVVVLVADVHQTVTADCSTSDIAAPCAGVIDGAPPSAECCAKLKEKAPCYCDYLKDPKLKPYLDSPFFRKVVETCAITLPTC